MSCKPTYKGKRYNSLEELYNANGVNEQQKQQAQQKFQEYVNSTGKQDIEGFKKFVGKKTKQPTKTQLKKDIGFHNNMSSAGLTGLKQRIDRYNKKHNTSHSYTENRQGISDNYNPDIVINFNPVNAIKKQQRAEMRSEEGKVFSDLARRIDMTNVKIRERIRPALIAEWGENIVNDAFNNFESIFGKHADTIITEADKWIFLEKYFNGEFTILC